MFKYLPLLLSIWIASPDWKQEVAEIDQEIAQLQDVQEQLRSKARRNVNNAMRWQFQNENYLDARRAWDQAAQQKQKIQELEDEIQGLKARRETILKEHGQVSS